MHKQRVTTNFFKLGGVPSALQGCRAVTHKPLAAGIGRESAKKGRRAKHYFCGAKS